MMSKSVSRIQFGRIDFYSHLSQTPQVRVTVNAEHSQEDERVTFNGITIGASGVAKLASAQLRAGTLTPTLAKNEILEMLTTDRLDTSTADRHSRLYDQH